MMSHLFSHPKVGSTVPMMCPMLFGQPAFTDFPENSAPCLLYGVPGCKIAVQLQSFLADFRQCCAYFQV